MKRRNLLTSIILKALNKAAYNMEELELMDAGSKEWKDSNLRHSGGIKIPSIYHSDRDDFLERHDLSVPDFSNRGLLTQAYMVQDQHSFIIPPIVEGSAFLRAGATFIPGQKGKLNVSPLRNIWASFAEDGEEPASDGDEITGVSVNFEPHRIYSCLDIPRMTLIQGGDYAEKYLREGIAASIREAVEKVLGGVAAADAKQPQGMGYKITTGTDTKADAVNPDLENLAELEEALASLNVPDEGFAFVTNANGRRKLRRMLYDTGGEAIHDGKLFGYPLYSSNAVSSAAGDSVKGNLLIFGYMPDLAIVQWSGYDITPDPVTLKKTGKVQLHINCYFDFKGLRGSLSTGEGTDADDYAYSFASMALLDAI